MSPNRRNRCVGNLDRRHTTVEKLVGKGLPTLDGRGRGRLDRGPVSDRLSQGDHLFGKQFKCRFVKETNYHRQDIFVGEGSIPRDPFTMIVRNQDMCNVLK